MADLTRGGVKWSGQNSAVAWLTNMFVTGGLVGSTHRFRRFIVTVMVLSLAGIFTGCEVSSGNTSDATSAQSLTSSPGNESGPREEPKSTSAAEVASNYFNAAIDGDFETAAQWVVKAQRGMVEALGLGSSAGQPKLTGDVSAGDLTLTGSTPTGPTAAVKFVGRMCRTPPKSGADPVPRRECVKNEDPNTDSPYFVVHLVQTADEGWQVMFPIPVQE